MDQLKSNFNYLKLNKINNLLPQTNIMHLFEPLFMNKKYKTDDFNTLIFIKDCFLPKNTFKIYEKFDSQNCN